MHYLDRQQLAQQPPETSSQQGQCSPTREQDTLTLHDSVDLMVRFGSPPDAMTGVCFIIFSILEREMKQKLDKQAGAVRRDLRRRADVGVTAPGRKKKQNKTQLGASIKRNGE